MKNFIYYILLIFIISSCSNSNISENEREILTKDYHGLEIDINDYENVGDLINSFQKLYCEAGYDTLWPVLFLNMDKESFSSPKESNNILKIGIEAPICHEVEFDLRRILEIVKDGNNYYVEGQRTPLDSIDSYIHMHYLNPQNKAEHGIGTQGKGIWICAEKAEPLKNIEVLLSTIINAYLNMSNEFSVQLFGKEISELNSDQLIELQQNLGFNLAFKYTDELPKVSIDF